MLQNPEWLHANILEIKFGYINFNVSHRTHFAKVQMVAQVKDIKRVAQNALKASPLRNKCNHLGELAKAKLSRIELVRRVLEEGLGEIIIDH